MKNTDGVFEGILSAALGCIISMALSTVAYADAPGTFHLAQAASEAKNADDDQRTQWNDHESKLLDTLASVSAEASKESVSPGAVEWSAAEKNVANLLYFRSQSGGGARSEWPTTQLSWVMATKRGLERSGEKDKKVHTDYTSELKILGLLADGLKEESEKSPDAPQTVAKDSDKEAEADDTVWKFRDGSGARTTKPRYKGQEPLN